MPRLAVLLAVVALAAAPAAATIVARGTATLQADGSGALDGTIALAPGSTALNANVGGALDVHATLVPDGAGGGTAGGTLTASTGADAFSATTAGEVACDDAACAAGAITLAADVGDVAGAAALPSGFLYGEDARVAPAGGALVGPWTLQSAPWVHTSASPPGCTGIGCWATANILATLGSNADFHDAERDVDVKVGAFVRFVHATSAGDTTILPRTRLSGALPPDHAFVDHGMFFDFRTTVAFDVPPHVCIWPSFIAPDDPLAKRLVLARRVNGTFVPASGNTSFSIGTYLQVCGDIDGPGILAVLVAPESALTTTTTTTTTTPDGGGTTTTTTAGSFRPPTTTIRPCATIRCRLRAVVSEGACAGQRIPKPLVRKLERAATLAERADRAPGTPAARRLRRRVGKLLAAGGLRAEAFARGRRPRLTPECAGSVRAVTAGVREDLGT
jgi:hypothetical protein